MKRITYNPDHRILLALPAMAMAKSDLVVVTDAPPKSMNPHAFLRTPTLSYMSNFFDGLLQRPAPGRQAGTGTGRQMGPGGCLTWKFELRKGVKFHNGNAFTPPTSSSPSSA
jgi:peptide/nickel transport system substrate-binding protein